MADLHLVADAGQVLCRASELVVSRGIALSTPALVNAKASRCESDWRYPSCFAREARAAHQSRSNSAPMPKTHRDRHWLARWPLLRASAFQSGRKSGYPGADLLDEKADLYVQELSSFQPWKKLLTG